MRQPRVLFAIGVVGLAAASKQVYAQPATTSHYAFTQKLVAAAVERANHHVRYVADYVRIPYPGGDVPADTGACTDEIIRIYRVVGIDLQKDVHEDMAADFAAYPKKWAAQRKHPDTNIDHRRVPNLMVFFHRKGETIPISAHADDYKPGDIVTWDLPGGPTHIGMVVDRQNFWGRHLIVHNIGEGTKIEDVLFNWKITGHFRYYGVR